MEYPKLTAELIEGLSGVYLSPRYDSPQPTPQFHRECWELYCSDDPMCAVAAPRGHAKSTALTHDYILATVLFRAETYVIVLGASEQMAIQHLHDIATELRENDDLRRAFMIKEFVTDQHTDIIVQCEDGHQFRIMARGAEQKIRGMKWNGRRPGLIVGDDLEDDEQVVNRDRRLKFSQWFYRACVQSLRHGGKIRVHGTILHDDSLLAGLMKSASWKTKFYRAHAGFSDFADILWPERFSEKELKRIRQTFIDKMDSAGYSQEFLNDPRDDEYAFLRKQDFLEISEEEREFPLRLAVGVDFAISKADKANRTSLTVGGLGPDNSLYFIDQRVARMDMSEIIDEMFMIQIRYSPITFFVEGGGIWRAIESVVYREMRERDVFMSITVKNPVKDKKSRGRSLQKRMRAGACKFDKEAEWYAEFEDELLRFTGNSEATLDDQFDSAAILSLGFEEFEQPEDDDFLTESEEEFRNAGDAMRKTIGRSHVTGY
jgi:predicted phage terminase large subunit-like protein